MEWAKMEWAKNEMSQEWNQSKMEWAYMIWNEKNLEWTKNGIGSGFSVAGAILSNNMKTMSDKFTYLSTQNKNYLWNSH